MTGRERPDPVAHKCLPRGLRDEVKLVLIVKMPAVQLGGKTVLQATNKARLLGRLVSQFG